MTEEVNFVKAAVASVGGPTRVANQLGVSSSTVHAWIKADRVPNWDRSAQLATLAKVSVDRLRSGPEKG